MDYKIKKLLVGIFCCLIITAGVYIMGAAIGKAWATYDKSSETVKLGD